MSMRSYARIGTPLLALLLASGCYDDGVYEDLVALTAARDTMSTDSDGVAEVTGISTVTGNTSASATGEDTTGGGGTGSGSGATTGDTDGTHTAGDAAPTIDGFTVNDELESVLVKSAGPVVMKAEASDDVKVAYVDFFWDGELLGSDAEAPYELSFDVDSQGMNGSHTAYAVAHDGGQASDSSDEIAVDIQLPFGGSQIWEAVDPSVFASWAHAVTTDSKGDVVVVGRVAISGDATRTRIKIHKYRGSDGKTLWEREVPSQVEDPAPQGPSVAHGVVVDSEDNVYVVGDLNPDNDGGHLWVGKYTADGVSNPDGFYTHPATNSSGQAIVVDRAHNDRVFVAGIMQKLNSRNGFIAELDPSLDPVWSDTLNGGQIDNNELYGITVDSTGDLVVTGLFWVGLSKYRGLILKFAPSGEQKWWRAANTPPDTKDVGYGLAIAENDVIVGIGRRASPQFQEALWLYKLDASGNELDTLVDNEAMCGNDGCRVAVDMSGNHVVGGALSTDQEPDFLVRKMNSEWSEELWSEAIDGFDKAQDRSLGVAVDKSGFVYGSGFKTKGGKPRWWVAKFNP